MGRSFQKYIQLKSPKCNLRLVSWQRLTHRVGAKENNNTKAAGEQLINPSSNLIKRTRVRNRNREPNGPSLITRHTGTGSRSGRCMVKVGHADEVVNRLTSRASRAAPSCRAFLIGPPHHQTSLSTRQYGPHHPLRPAVHVQVFLVMPGARGAQRYLLSPQQSTAHGCVYAKLSRLHGNRAHADFRCGVIEGNTDVIGCRVCDDVSCCVA